MLKDEDLLHIPDCLNRALWTEEQVKANEASWQRLGLRLAREAAEKRREHERALINVKLEREARDNAKADRRQQRADRKARKHQRAADRAKVVDLIRAGHVNIGQMAKASDITQERLKPAIRWLLRHERISKATPRTYSAV